MRAVSGIHYLIHSASVALLSSACVAILSITIAIASAAASAAVAGSTGREGEPAATRSAATRSLYIVQAATLSAAQQSVARVHAKLDRKLKIIHAVSAYLTTGQADRLRNTAGVHVFRDRKLSSQSCLLGLVCVGNYLTLVTPLSPLITPLIAPLVTTTDVVVVPPPQDGTGVPAPSLLYQTNYPILVGADSLQQSGITGKGVTIAVLDSGLWQDPDQNFGSRVLASIDVVNGGSGAVQGDAFGHGTHVTSIAAGGAQNASLAYLGIAPQANLVIVQALDGTGAGTYTDVIAGLDWIVANRAKYNIRVLNLSIGAQPQSFYWDDPVDQAVMAAWQAGIVVVAAAGNEGPGAMTIDVPGNVPYIITVGALTDNYTPYDLSDDWLASFSSAGPTFEGFVKPELIAPGGHMAASMSRSSYLANIDPNSMGPGEQLFTMSGTSQAAAVTSGVVALMLQNDPSLTPDTVKCRLLASSRPAVTSSGTLAYSVFQQGAGLINAPAAVNSTATGCANVGLDINADLAGTEHFGGPANQDANGNYYIMDLSGGSTSAKPLPGDGFTWSQGYTYGPGYTWSEGYTWTQGYAWTQGYPWGTGATWTPGDVWDKGYAWGGQNVPWWTNSQAAPGTSPAPIVPWVPNE